MAKKLIRFGLLVLSFLIFWQAVIFFTQTPKFILPPPLTVFKTLISAHELLFHHALTTFLEIMIGLFFGIFCGATFALLLQANRWLSQWLSPLLIGSQAIPLYALAPVLTLWFGYGMLPKVLMTILIIFFPITTAAYDGLRQTPQRYLDLAQTMNASAFRTLIHIRLPAALPAFASGMRVAVAIAPIGAVIGEWVGGSVGLGYLMTYANARSQSELLFAALAVLVLMALSLYYSADRLLSFVIDKYGVSS